LDKFVERISEGLVTSVQTGRIYGPFVVPGVPLLATKVELFIGKVSRNLRSKSA
jgi:hypothetical protein